MPDNQWGFVPLRQLFRINGFPVIPADRPESLFHYHSIPSFDENGGCVVEFGSEIESNKTKINKPSVLVSKLNPRKPRVSLAEPKGDEEHCCSTEFICYEPKNENEILEFWRAYFLSTGFAKRLEQIAVGSTNSHTRAAPRETLDWLVPNPSESQKRAISTILDALDTQIRQTEAIIAKLQQVKQGLLHDLLTRGIDEDGQLRPPYEQAPELYKDSPLGWIPKQWEVGSLSDLCSELVDCPHTTPDYRDEGIYVARTMHIKNGEFLQERASRVSEEGYINRIDRLKPMPGDVIFTREAPVGEAFVIPEGMRICLGQRVMVIRPKKDSLFSNFLLHQIYSGQIQKRMKVLTAGTTNPHLNVADVREMLIPVPPLAEQKEIVRLLDGQKLRERSESEKIEKLKKQKAGLMDDLLTGRVRVTELIDQQQQAS